MVGFSCHDNHVFDFRGLFPVIDSMYQVSPNAVMELNVTNFRNYSAMMLELDKRPVVLIGENGMGKTNLLEAVSLLAPGRGLRRAKADELHRQSPNVDNSPMADLGWGVSGRVATRVGDVDIATGAHKGDKRRQVRINGNTGESQTKLADYVNAVWLTPQMDRLFLDGASARRRFLDRLVYGFDTAHAGRISGYEKAMRDRNRLLKDGCTDDIWLSSLEKQMADRAIAIAAARKDVVRRLNHVCRQPIGPFPGAEIGLNGIVENGLDSSPAIEVENRLIQALKNARDIDRETGTTSIGVHKTDMPVFHPMKNMLAESCSTGEQKALLIAIVLGHCQLQSAETGTVPLLLLDEVAAHLDKVKRHALFETLLEYGAQAWLTGTDESVFAHFGHRAQYIRVHDASLEKITV